MSREVLKEAMDRMADRVDAVLGDGNAGVGVADARLIVSDLGIDAALVKGQMHNLAEVVVGLWVKDPTQALCCMISDVLLQAVATGVVHERVRVEHERRAG